MNEKILTLFNEIIFKTAEDPSFEHIIIPRNGSPEHIHSDLTQFRKKCYLERIKHKVQMKKDFPQDFDLANEFDNIIISAIPHQDNLKLMKGLVFRLSTLEGLI